MKSEAIIEQLITSTELSNRVVRGDVIDVTSQAITVETIGSAKTHLICNVLQTSSSPVAFLPGDEVIVLKVSASSGTVLGRVVSPAVSVQSMAACSPSSVPDELVVEAKNKLTLKCGDGSITIRNDGKVLIKGKDLVSRAQQANRIKGGSVSIN